MTTIKAFIRTSKSDKCKPANVRFRLSDGRIGIDKNTGNAYNGIQLFHKSELTVLPDRWDERQQKIKARAVIDEKEKKNFDKAINDRKDIIRDIYLMKGKSLTPEVLELEIDKYLNPEHYVTPDYTFFFLFNKFISDNNVSPSSLEKRFVVCNALQRFEEHDGIKLDVDTVSSDTLRLFENYLRNEHSINKKQPARSTNTLAVMFKIIRTFFIWCNINEFTTNKPFLKYKAPSEKYGTPFYLTVAERNELYHFDLSNNPALSRQRDIFIFQCVIGCRIGDLQKFTKDNIVDGAIQYIAEKTKGKEPKTIRVPLNSIASEILAKYAGLDNGRLLPFIQPQKHNNELKRIFAMAGITRKVTIPNKLTRIEEVRPLNELASSHLARRTFCANLYKMVKDPNLVGALSGHSEGSKAFARYRDIDEDDKVELVKMLE
jgi:integrase